MKDLESFKEQEQKLIAEINILSQETDDHIETSDQAESGEFEEIDPDSQIVTQSFENEATEEDKKQDVYLKSNLLSREKEVDSLEFSLNQKQKILDAIVESNKEMRQTIVDTMKQEYLKKIILLQSEIK